MQILALNIQGGGGTSATPAPPGAFVAVESILGATKPSLGGNNNAVFSLTLEPGGRDHSRSGISPGHDARRRHL